MENRKRNKLKKFAASAFCFCMLCFGFVMLNGMEASAAEQTIFVNDDDDLDVTVHLGDTGTIMPNVSSLAASDTDGQDIRFEYDLAWYSGTPCISIDASGRYQAAALGEGTVEIEGRNSRGWRVFSARVSFDVRVDMSNVTLEKTKFNGYLIPYYGYQSSYESIDLDIKVNSPVVLNENMHGINLSSKVSGKNVRAYASLSDNVLHLQIYGEKKCTAKVTVVIAGKKFQITVYLKPLKISDNSLLLEKGKTKKLKLSGCSDPIQWSSSNKKIATVSKSGVVTGKKMGNVVITAKIGGKRIGCAVSVTTRTLKKVCERATYIGTHWKYSQAKRAQQGYYDCSALVWKAYKECAGVNFGSDSYPGTTATESVWCRDHNRLIKGGYTQKKVNKMQLNPGDIVFKSNNLNDPYKTTYHVEMFTGYACVGYDSKGKPYTTPLWASRGAGYGAADGSLLARPMK